MADLPLLFDQRPLHILQFFETFQLCFLEASRLADARCSSPELFCVVEGFVGGGRPSSFEILRVCSGHGLVVAWLFVAADVFVEVVV